MVDCLGISLIESAKTNDASEIMGFLSNSTIFEVLRTSSLLEDCLRVAAEKGCLEVVQLLLDDAAVNKDTVNARNQTALHLACAEGHISVVRILLEQGASVDARDYAERTPLMYAAIWGYREIMELLIQHGADIGAVDKNGDSPMRLAKNDHSRRVIADYICGLKTIAAQK